MRALLITVHFHDGRYHGRPDWPPSPARLFQALVAGAAQSERLDEEDERALAWLQALEAPVIATPPARPGQGFKSYVPNNDRDSVERRKFKNCRDYLAALGKIRTEKPIRPMLFNAEVPLLYIWPFGDTLDERERAQRICAVAERLYQLGRGVDMAWAQAEILDQRDVPARLAGHDGVVYRPCKAYTSMALSVPLEGSLRSLIERFDGTRIRFQTLYEIKPSKKEPGRKTAAGQIFIQPPKPRFRQVAYDSPPKRLLFDLVGALTPQPLDHVVILVERVRDAVAGRLKDKLPEEMGRVDKVVVGSRASGDADKSARVRIVPLPSIGHRHADQAIRRVLIEIPANCPLRADSLAWSFSGLEAIPAEIDPDTGEVHEQLTLVPASDSSMLTHYGIVEPEQDGFRVWRTVTPIAVPVARQRGQVGGRERAINESQAVQAVRQALRHAGIAAAVEAIRVQREPWSGNGVRAEAFAPGSRFDTSRLWHAEIRFVDPVSGPLVIGDGRYLGLGLMQRVEDAVRDALIFPIREDTRPSAAHGEAVVNALRRALMSRAADADRRVSPLFSGHEADAGPARSGHHRHVYLFADDSDGDGLLDRVGILAPWRVDRSWRPDRKTRVEFDRVASGLRSIRAGSAGLLSLDPPCEPDDGDPLFARTRAWTSRTPYLSTRHPKRRVDARVAAADDLQLECDRRGLPRPRVEIVKVEASPRGGVEILARLHFHTAVAGPILLGRDAHRGGGLFAAQR